MVAIRKKIYPILLTIVVTFLFLIINKQPNMQHIVIKHNNDFLIWNYSLLNNSKGAWRKLNEQQIKNLSTLGRILYLNDDYPIEEENTKQYVILIWKYGKVLENRHIKHFTKKIHDPFEKCSVRNCEITYNDTDINKADLVLFHLQRIKGPKDLPSQENRNPKQFWTFLTDESPFHIFLAYSGQLKDFNNLFNWSMNYRMNSDIPVPYGRATELDVPKQVTYEDFEIWRSSKKQDVLVAIMGSNCGGKNNRWEYVHELKKYIKIDMYGGCGTLKCPGHFKADCPTLSKYMFYLAFENSNCPEYLTEKLWWNAYSKDAIPIIMGSSKDTIEQLLPPYSYIYVEDFASPRDLASYLNYINSTSSELYNYFQWRSYFEIQNEHGYFQSDPVHYCRICEALNYNKKNTKIYSNLEEYWNKKDCFPSWNQ